MDGWMDGLNLFFMFFETNFADIKLLVLINEGESLDSPSLKIGII